MDNVFPGERVFETNFQKMHFSEETSNVLRRASTKAGKTRPEYTFPLTTWKMRYDIHIVHRKNILNLSKLSNKISVVIIKTPHAKIFVQERCLTGTPMLQKCLEQGCPTSLHSDVLLLEYNQWTVEVIKFQGKWLMGSSKELGLFLLQFFSNLKLNLIFNKTS